MQKIILLLHKGTKVIFLKKINVVFIVSTLGNFGEDLSVGDAPAEKYNSNILNIFHSHGWENVVFLVEKNWCMYSI